MNYMLLRLKVIDKIRVTAKESEVQKCRKEGLFER